MKQIINCETGEVIERDFNEEELAQVEIDTEMIAESNAIIEDKAATKAALLERLGITADEAALLIG
jgi:hypothetical protein